MRLLFVAHLCQHGESAESRLSLVWGSSALESCRPRMAVDLIYSWEIGIRKLSRNFCYPDSSTPSPEGLTDSMSLEELPRENLTGNPVKGKRAPL